MRKEVSAGTRIASMFVDHIFMCVIAAFFFIPVWVAAFSASFDEDPEREFLSFQRIIYFSLSGMALYFCKDCFKGRSLAKRIFRLQVIDDSTGMPASPLKCFVRNIFCIIWPVEVIVALVQPGRRIGDIVAGTRVVEYEGMTHQADIRWPQVLLSFALSYGLMLAVLSAIGPPNMGSRYSKSSYNAAMSRELTQLYTDSLGGYAIPNVKVYDSIPGDKRKYASVVLHLKENYLKDDPSMRELDAMVRSLLYSRLPRRTFKGRIQYIYRGAGVRSMRAMDIE